MPAEAGTSAFKGDKRLSDSLAQSAKRGRALTALALLLSLAVGAACGIGGYTFIYARGLSYMTDDPVACANCHVMNDQYRAWTRSSHRNVAVCNDCHTPNGLISKYLTKAENGYHHSLAFTTMSFHEPIQIKARNRAITEASCRKCHADITAALDGPHAKDGVTSCLRCHRDVGHLH